MMLKVLAFLIRELNIQLHNKIRRNNIKFDWDNQRKSVEIFFKN